MGCSTNSEGPTLPEAPVLRGRSVLEQRRAETRGAESATAKGTGPDILTAPAGLPYSKGRDDRSSPPYLPYLPDPTPYSQLLPPSLQLSGPSPPGGQSPPGTLGATGKGLDSCKDSESSCEYGVGSGRYGRLGGGVRLLWSLE